MRESREAYVLSPEMTQAIESAEATGALTGTGIPGVQYLTDTLGRPIGSKERDDAWAAYQAAKAAAEAPPDPEPAPDPEPDAPPAPDPEAETAPDPQHDLGIENTDAILAAIERDDPGFFNLHDHILYNGAISGRTYLIPYIVAHGAWECFRVARNQSRGRIHGLQSHTVVNPMILEAPEGADIPEWLEERRRFMVGSLPLYVFADSPQWPFHTLPKDAMFSVPIPGTTIPTALLSPHSEAYGGRYPVQLYNRQLSKLSRLLPLIPSWDGEHAEWTGTKDVRILELLNVARTNRRAVTVVI